MEQATASRRVAASRIPLLAGIFCVASAWIALSPQAGAWDTEPLNDSYAGREKFLLEDNGIATSLSGLKTSTGDEDWFELTKPKCDEVILKLVYYGLDGDAVRIDLLENDGDPNKVIASRVVTESFLTGGNYVSIVVPYREDPKIVFRVVGVYVEGTDGDGLSEYDVAITYFYSQVNQDLEHTIRQLKRKRARAKRELRVALRHDARDRNKSLRKLRRHIRKLGRRVDQLTGRLCR